MAGEREEKKEGSMEAGSSEICARNYKQLGLSRASSVRAGMSVQDNLNNH